VLRKINRPFGAILICGGNLAVFNFVLMLLYPVRKIKVNQCSFLFLFMGLSNGVFKFIYFIQAYLSNLSKKLREFFEDFFVIRGELNDSLQQE